MGDFTFTLQVPNIEVDPEGFTIAQLKLQSVIHQYFVIIKNNKMCKYTYARSTYR